MELSETLRELERRGIKGRILTTDYLCFSDPYALDRLAALKNVELKMYHVDEAGVGLQDYYWKFQYDTNCFVDKYGMEYTACKY